MLWILLFGIIWWINMSHVSYDAFHFSWKSLQYCKQICSRQPAPRWMSVWESGDAEYFRTAIFRGSYTFRIARIETFNWHSGCQGTGFFFFFFLPSVHRLTIKTLIINDDSFGRLLFMNHTFILVTFIIVALFCDSKQSHYSSPTMCWVKLFLKQ